MAVTFFFDSYALFELLHANPDYLATTQDAVLVTTQFQLMELHFVLLRHYGEVHADRVYDSLQYAVVPIADAVIKDANRLKLRLNKRDISYIDCVGYTQAKSLGIKFLTGDKEFQHMENVEFVK